MSSDNFAQLIAALSELDQLIEQELKKSTTNTEDIVGLVDSREEIVISLLNQLTIQPELKQQPEWQSVVQRTQTLLVQMQQETAVAGRALQQYRQGQRSIQHYKRFT
ncbi:flagellar protein FliT [Vibrio sp. SM6]|uniref:Flagellar protein FliT n=1 Tax=Vibrio agarilyticus TaxID=2726741 RepID=A0A7X8TQZ6_9VIBR|nr:flagellar protein FliT [Vibrio agarilyticus]NLS13221.1 flagellar protein FliT [Vibrio agarilyticus]